MPCRLIINADDFGFTEHINRAVWDLAQNNTLSSTNVMANMPYADAITQVAADCPSLGIGVHINLTQGQPISAPSTVPSLVDKYGSFWPRRELVRRALHGQISAKECQREIAAQVARVQELAGTRVDHWNSHEGIHRYEPITSAALSVCHGAGIAGMRTHRHKFIGAGGQQFLARLTTWAKETYYRWLSWRGRRHFVLADGILAIYEQPARAVIQFLVHNELPAGTWELICHPAVSTSGLIQTTMLDARVEEYRAMSSDAFRNVVARLELTRFVDLVGQGK